MARRWGRGAAGWLVGGVIGAGLVCCDACGGSSPPAAEENARGPRAASRTADESEAAAEVSEVSWREPIEVAVGNAYAGPWRMNDSKFHYVDDPTVAVGRDGGVAVAWVDNRRQDVLFRRYDSRGEAMFDQPVDVSRSPDIFSWLPDLEASDDGQEVSILWQEIVFSGGSHGGEIFFAHSTDGGRSFARPVNLSNSEAGDGKGRLTEKLWHNGSLDLARDAEGVLYAAWTEYEGTLWLRRTEDGGEHFADAVLVAGSDERPARAPDLAIAPDGAVYLAWAVGEADGADIHLAASTDGGKTFGEPRPVFDSDGHSDTPSIAVDGRGTVHLVYAESPSGMLGRYHLRYARLPDGQPAGGAPVRLTAPGSSGGVGARFPTVRLNGNDDIVVIWERHPEPRARPRGLGFASSTDRGQSFTEASLVPGTTSGGDGFNGGMQGLLGEKLAVNDAGAIAVVNSRFAPNEASLVRLLLGQLKR